MGLSVKSVPNILYRISLQKTEIYIISFSVDAICLATADGPIVACGGGTKESKPHRACVAQKADIDLAREANPH